MVIAALLHELSVPDSAASLIVAHAEAVGRDADRLGLVTERTTEDILRRHSADSLLFALVRAPAKGEEWVDAGSGAGFPGLVLACAFPQARFTLLEPQQRRMGFLELVSLNLGLGNVRVSRHRVQHVEAHSADVVTARALEDPDKTVPDLRRLLRAGGTALVAVSSATNLPTPGQVVDVRRADVDSPGLLLMMPGIP